MLFVLPCLKTAHWLIKVACSQPLGRRFPWQPWLNSLRMTFSCNCVCILSSCVQESFLWCIVRSHKKIKKIKILKTQGVCCGFPKSPQTLRAFLTHGAVSKGRRSGSRDIMWAQSCFWTACVLLFSCIFCFCPHMFPLWLLSSLGLYAIMLLGNCRRRMRSVGCVCLSCEEDGGTPNEWRSARQMPGHRTSLWVWSFHTVNVCCP